MKKRKPTTHVTASKPTVFIGSSTEGLRFAQHLQLGLARVATCRLWTQGVFGLGRASLESLVEAAVGHDFAILVLTPDDLATKRGSRRSIPRDNVIFELGLFMGALGRERTYIVHCRDQPIELPSDLAGITTATFSGGDADLQVALGEVCTKLEETIKTCTPRHIRDLDGQWYSRYQRQDTELGRWVPDTTVVQSGPGSKVSFKNTGSVADAKYEAIGEYREDGEIVGVWKETRPGAKASGCFHLYVDRFGSKMYGLCTGPSGKGEMIYGGWVLAREAKKLDDAQRSLAEAMLVGHVIAT